MWAFLSHLSGDKEMASYNLTNQYIIIPDLFKVCYICSWFAQDK